MFRIGVNFSSVHVIEALSIAHRYGMVWYGMVNVDLYSAIVTKVSNALKMRYLSIRLPLAYHKPRATTADSHRHTRHDTDRTVLSFLVWRCELSRPDRPTSAFCVGVRPAVAPAAPAPPDTLRR